MSTLLAARSVLVVCAHPDDESFGLGGVINALTETGSTVSLVCFTRGEASTLGGSPPDLPALRADELRRASAILGLTEFRLLGHADGQLADVPLPRLTAEVLQMVEDTGADTLLGFDPNGVTGHSDHRRATEAALSAADARGLAVLTWIIPAGVATTLNSEFGTAFAGRDPSRAEVILAVDRERQWRAIAEHRSQATDNPVLDRRLELMGATEWLSWLRRPAGTGGGSRGHGTRGMDCAGRPRVSPSSHPA